MSELTHLDGDGRARMVDVSDKAVTTRIAVARGRLVTTAEVIALVRADGLPKADVLATARIGGISGAKKTADLIPLCHPLPLSSLTVNFELGESSIEIEATAKTTGRTGVEMEALTAVSIAGLTLHDMVKAVDPAAMLTDIRLEEKSGGKRGLWTRATALDSVTQSAPHLATEIPPATERQARTAHVIVASTRGASGERPDTTGPVIADWLRELGFETPEPIVVADADIQAALTASVAEQPTVIITTGGTGVSPTDATPEATGALLDQQLPGVAEALRARGLTSTPMAALSRGLAGVAGRTVVVNLPGSRGGVADGLAVLTELLPHLVDQVSGSAQHA
jgi:cyclic pyranopterin phosphate synthase